MSQVRAIPHIRSYSHLDTAGGLRGKAQQGPGSSEKCLLQMVTSGGVWPANMLGEEALLTYCLHCGQELLASCPYCPFVLYCAHFQVPKMGLPAPESKNEDHFFTPTSPKTDVLDICFTCCHFWMRNKHILNVILASFLAVHNSMWPCHWLTQSLTKDFTIKEWT